MIRHAGSGLLLAVLVLAAPPVYAGCSGSEAPACSGRCPNAAWWSRYKQWCEACGGKTYQDSRGGGCEPGPNWGGKTGEAAPAGSAGSALDQAYGDALSAAQNSSQVMQATGLYLGAALLTEALRPPTPEEQAAAEARRQFEAEQARLRELEAERRSQALLAEMMGDEQGGNEADAAAAGDGELQLIVGDAADARDFMPNRKPRKKRTPPPAVRKDPVPTARIPAAAGGDALQFDFGDGGASPGRPGEGARLDAGRPGANAAPRARVQGELDGQNCAQRQGARLCADTPGADGDTCRRDYDSGYAAGARRLEQELRNRGEAAGRRDRPGGRNAALGHADARGSCGHVFIDAYNRAFGGR